MCLIIIGKTKDILKLDLNAAWRTNPHGAGIMYSQRYKNQKHNLIISKGLMQLNEFKKALKSLDNIEIAVHLRMATHGQVNQKNTHPFKIDRHTALMHNGMLELGSAGVNGQSDSAHLAGILSYLPAFERINLLNALSGKFCLLQNSKFYSIGNFENFKNCIVSNTYWMPFHNKVYTYNYFDKYKNIDDAVNENLTSNTSLLDYKKFDTI